MSTPNLRRSRRDHVARKCASGLPDVGEGKVEIYESLPKAVDVAQGHTMKIMHAKVEANQKNVSSLKRLDARGYRKAVKEKFKGLRKESGVEDKEPSGIESAMDRKSEKKESCETGEQVILQLDDKDRTKDEEQMTESKLGDSRQSAAANGSMWLDKSPENQESCYFSRKRKHPAEMQQDCSVSGTRSGKIYKSEVQGNLDANSLEGADIGQKEDNPLDDSGMDLFVAVPIGDSVDGQASSNETKLNELVETNDTGPKELVWAETQKGRWWPAFSVVQPELLQGDISASRKGLQFAQLIYSDDLRTEPKFVEARSLRPFGENYEDLKNIHNDKSFLDAVNKSYKLYQDCLVKRNHLDASAQVAEPISMLEVNKANAVLDVDGVDPSTVNHMRTTGGNEVPVIEEPDIEAASPAQSSGSGGKSLNDCYSNFCQICNEGGKLLCCDGKDCQRTYHLDCLDPPLVHVPPGAWYCPTCAYKRVSKGVYSVCRGIESIWKVKDIDIEEDCVERKMKFYFVKSEGLSHLHNRWVTEKLLIDQAPKKLATFKKKLKEGKVPNYNPEWAELDRLIQKRSLICAKDLDKERRKARTGRCIEWFIKWKGLGYDQCSWELENTKILTSESAKQLMKAYEHRSNEAQDRANPEQAIKAKKLRESSFSRLKKIPEWMKGGQEFSINLKSVNKLREFWQNHRNALVIDEINQERITMAISFILSLIKEFNITRPVLIVTSTAGISCWETEFLRWASSINTVFYCGNQNSREVIQKLEFYDEESGCVMVQVVISTSDVVSADLNFLKCIEWEVLIVDECQRVKFSQVLAQMDQLQVDFRIMLFSEQPKDNVAEVSHLLSFLDYLNVCQPKDSSEHQQQDSSEYLSSLKSKLSEYVVHERKSDHLSPTTLIEYWVPVELGNVQIEQYCTILLTNMNTLCKMLKKNDCVEALRDILLSLRKCCNHPYLEDVSLQSSLRNGCKEVEYLDIDINASSKLQVLDNVLSELRSQGQRVLILFQMIGRSAGISIGDILDDHIRQRFGVDSYERVDGCLSTTKKQAALQMFNNKDSGRFVFLLEKRACGTSIKLSLIDTVIIFDSDWNPLNDLRALQKVQFDTHAEHLKIFRFYSPYTWEERVLISAKQENVLDNHLENLNASVCQSLLKWGTSHLFERYVELHETNGPNSKLTSGCNDENLKSLAKDILAYACQSSEPYIRVENSLIQKLPQSGVYGKVAKLLGESENQLTDESMPSNIFWTKLLKGRDLEKYGSSGHLQRTRKKVQYCETSPTKSVPEPDEVEAKRKRRRVNETVDPMSITSWLEETKKSLGSGKETNENSIEGLTDGTNQASNESVKEKSRKPSLPTGMKSSADIYSGKHPSPCSGSSDSEMEAAGFEYKNVNSKSSLAMQAALRVEEHEDAKALRLAQECLHNRIKPELVKLCKILKLSDEVTSMAEEFLSYVMNNYRLPKEPTSLLQAVEVSLCCAAAGCLKYRMDLETAIELAKSHLNFECKRAEIESVYSKLREHCLSLRGDIPFIPGHSGRRVTASSVNSASKQLTDEMHLQDDGVSTSTDKNHSKRSMQKTSIQDSFNSHDSPRVHDNQVIADTTLNMVADNGLGGQCQTLLNMPGKEPLEASLILNTQTVENGPNNTDEQIETNAINQHEFNPVVSMGAAYPVSGPGSDISSGCRSDILSPEKIKKMKEQIQALKQVTLRQQQAQVAGFFKHRENEIKNLEAMHSEECCKIRSSCQNAEVREAKLKDAKIRHAQIAGQLEDKLREVLDDLKSRQSAVRDKEHRQYATLLKDIDVGKFSKSISDLIESGSIPVVSEPLHQISTTEVCESIPTVLPSVVETGRSNSISTSEHQHDKGTPSESSTVVASSQSPELRENQPVNGQTTLVNDLPQNEMDTLQRTCRPRSSMERSRSRLYTHVEGQADATRPSQDFHTQQHPSQPSSVHPDSTVSPRGDGEQYQQVSEPGSQVMHGIHRSQNEHGDNILSHSPSLVTIVPVESSQPLQDIGAVERPGFVPDASMVASSLSRGSDPIRNMQCVVSTPNSMQFRMSASARATQTNFSDPLYHEMLKIKKEQERLKKVHDEETKRIHGEFEKDLEELKRKYTALFQDSEFAYAQKKRILESNFIKVDMNRRLAEAFKMKDSNSGMPAGQAGSSILLQPSRQQTTPVSNGRLSQLATSVVHSGMPMVSSDHSTSCSPSSVSGIQAGGIFYSHMQNNDYWAPGLQVTVAPLFNPGVPLQNTGQGVQLNSPPHNIGVVSDMLNRNIQPSGLSSSIMSGALSTQARQLQAQGNMGQILSNAYLSDANSLVSQRLQLQESGNLRGSLHGNYNSGSSLPGCMPGHQSQPHFHNQNTFVNTNHANTAAVGASARESSTQAPVDFGSGNSAFLFPLQGVTAASQERMDIAQVASSCLQEMNRNITEENCCTNTIQHPTQENVPWGESGSVGALHVYGNNASDVCALTRGQSSASESILSHSSFPETVQPTCNNIAQCSNNASVICLSDDE